ncbi:SDR family oxidoreductase [Abyssibius alkaniclasticus]|uniref:SDR family oxidoreductase n=1 Tax=Abyssibius alkaniclasticus TaxID=2881234 RepID=UPI0023649F0F|nr:SDR family oxidoreductase [Abyssibius alkaniclasticus]UPH70974.1 SDR family oxidoreductase [Abyssibius alkaniclasticus]
MNRLKGKTCLVTAAGQGIGRAAALRLAAEGARVIATDINTRLLDSLTALETAQLDVTRPGEIAEFTAAIGPVDVLFNCAGIVHRGNVLDCSEADWDFAFDLNVKAMFSMIKGCLPGMVEQKSGSIINMSSVVSSLRGVLNRCAYGASKAAVIGLTKSVAVDFASRGIRCNAICPGAIDSPSLHDRLAEAGDFDAAKRDFTASQPMKRLGTVDEVAALVAFLASDEAAFMTGQTHVIDGGGGN